MSGSDDDGGCSAIDDDDDGIDFCSRDGAAFFFRPKDKFIGPSPRPVKSCCGLVKVPSISKIQNGRSSSLCMVLLFTMLLTQSESETNQFIHTSDESVP